MLDGWKAPVWLSPGGASSMGLFGRFDQDGWRSPTVCECESRRNGFHVFSHLSCEWSALMVCPEELFARTRSQPAAAKAPPATVDTNAVTWPRQINKNIHNVFIYCETIKEPKTAAKKVKHETQQENWSPCIFL